MVLAAGAEPSEVGPGGPSDDGCPVAHPFDDVLVDGHRERRARVAERGRRDRRVQPLLKPGRCDAVANVMEAHRRREPGLGGDVLEAAGEAIGIDELTTPVADGVAGVP
jgi:hypothetical protein